MEMAVDPVYKRGESWRVRVGNNEPEARFKAWDILNRNRKEVVMLRWALGFFIVALLAAVLGFSGIAMAAAGIAKIIFFIFLLLFLVSLVGHLLRRT
jgi:uncharacterized membrane protein YtjA (UPF0391 family)